MRHLLDTDIHARFSGIYGALRATGDWRDRREWLRFAAQAAVLCPLEPGETAKRIRAAAATLRAGAGWFSDLRTPWRFVLAALLVQDGIAVDGFVAGLAGDHERLRAAGLRHGGMYETMAIAILRHLGGTLDEAQVARLTALYKRLKQHHWWLTGPDDLPACACLTAIPGAPEALVARIDANLGHLRSSGFTPGNHLLHAACLLALPDLADGVATLRFRDLAKAFAQGRTALWHEDYDALAVLCLLSHEPQVVVQRVGEYVTRLTAEEPTLQGQATFNLAADLAFLDLARCDARGFRLHTSADLTGMLATLRLGSAAGLLLSTGADSIAAVELAEWPPTYPVGMAFP